MSHVDVKNLKPSSFEDEHYDRYEYYNLSDKYAEGSARKGRTKKEASDNTNRHNPSGHERKIVEKLQNTEKKEKEEEKKEQKEKEEKEEEKKEKKAKE